MAWNGDWGPAIGPWMILASNVLGTWGWYVYGRVRDGEWNWKVPRGSKIDLVSGRTPKHDLPEEGEFVDESGETDLGRYLRFRSWYRLSVECIGLYCSIVMTF